MYSRKSDFLFWMISRKYFRLSWIRSNCRRQTQQLHVNLFVRRFCASWGAGHTFIETQEEEMKTSSMLNDALSAVSTG